jgi:hypothetical protein
MSKPPALLDPVEAGDFNQTEQHKGSVSMILLDPGSAERSAFADRSLSGVTDVRL